MTPLLVSADYMTPLAPSDVVRAVQRVDPSLDLKWMPMMASWALIAPWRESDPRHGMVKRGEIGAGAAFDIVCHLPADCAVEQAESYLRRGLVSSSRDDLVKMLDRLDQMNAAQQDANMDAAIAPVMDDLDSLAGRRLTDTSASFLNDATQRPPRRKRRS